MTKFKNVQVEKIIWKDDTEFNGSYNSLSNKPTLFSGDYDDLDNKPTLFSGDYDDLTNKPTGITSSFQIGFVEFLIENGLITAENEVWTYEGVLTVGIETKGGEGNYFYGLGYGFGSIDPVLSGLYIYWKDGDDKLGISYTILNTIGKVTIDEGLGEPMSYTGTPAGCSTAITITADEDGIWSGNFKANFNGTKTINEGILAHNTADPTHTVTLTSGDGTQVPDNKVTTNLTGGKNEFLFEASDFETPATNKTLTVNTITNPFPVLSGTHSIKLQFS